MKSLLFSLTVVSLFVISTYNQPDPPSVNLDIPNVIDLASADLEAIEQQIQKSTAFAEIEVYDKWGEKIYQSQEKTWAGESNSHSMKHTKHTSGSTH